MGFPPLLNLSTRLSTAAWPGQTTKTAQTLEFMFQNVAYWPTVYRTGAERQLLAKLLLDGRADPDKDFIHYVVLIGIQRRVCSLKPFSGVDTDSNLTMHKKVFVVEFW